MTLKPLSEMLGLGLHELMPGGIRADTAKVVVRCPRALQPCALQLQMRI